MRLLMLSVAKIMWGTMDACKEMLRKNWQDIVKLLGKDSLPEKGTMEEAKNTHEDLQQNSITEQDYKCPLAQAIGMMIKEVITGFSEIGGARIGRTRTGPTRSGRSQIGRVGRAAVGRAAQMTMPEFQPQSSQLRKMEIIDEVSVGRGDFHRHHWAWLQILAAKSKQAGKIVTPQEVAETH